MPDLNEEKSVVSKIDLFLEGKGKKPKTNYRSLVAIRKLMNAPWGDERHLREMALDCFAELAEIDDEPAKEFMKRLFTESGLIGQSVIKMYMTNNDIDMLPPKR